MLLKGKNVIQSGTLTIVRESGVELREAGGSSVGVRWDQSTGVYLAVEQDTM